MDIVGFIVGIVYGPKWPFYSCCDYIGLFGTGFIQVLYLGRAPRTKETLPDFREKCQVTRHSRVFRGLTGSQQTPRIRGVTSSIPIWVFACIDLFYVLHLQLMKALFVQSNTEEFERTGNDSLIYVSICL